MSTSGLDPYFDPMFFRCLHQATAFASRSGDVDLFCKVFKVFTGDPFVFNTGVLDSQSYCVSKVNKGCFM